MRPRRSRAAARHGDGGWRRLRPRRFDAPARLWDAIGQLDTAFELGFCFDTCPAHAAGEELSDAVERVLAVVGEIDLLQRERLARPPGLARTATPTWARASSGSSRSRR